MKYNYYLICRFENFEYSVFYRSIAPISKGDSISLNISDFFIVVTVDYILHKENCDNMNAYCDIITCVSEVDAEKQFDQYEKEHKERTK